MAAFTDPTEMQDRLFAELSRMFGKEVPLYDKAQLVNAQCNITACRLLGKRHPGFTVSEAELERAGGERHGAIRIGRPDEFRWIGRFFRCFGMAPHNFYDMTNVGARSQPVIATAFRSSLHPDHRVFTSLLMTDYFDPTTKSRIETLLAGRDVFSPRAKELIERCERRGGLDSGDADALIAEAKDRIFKWTGKARDHVLYRELCDAGFKIAADIACFESHHLNHLTPNTLCMDLHTAAMKFCLGVTDEATFRRRARLSLERLAGYADGSWMRLHFKHFPTEQLDHLDEGTVVASDIASLADALASRLKQPDLLLSQLQHAGYKDLTEGPSEDTPVLLRQAAYRALTEPVRFTNLDGSVVDGTHTARFGEIEQRFYATTPAGRALYDRCLAAAEAEGATDPGLAKRDFDAHEAKYARHFAPFPKSLDALLERSLVFGEYQPTAKGLAAAGSRSIATTDLKQLVRLGYVSVNGLRYEDFLPVSAAGIFASNLNQYGTKSTARQRPAYSQAQLEEILDMRIIDAESLYRTLEDESIRRTYSRLGLVDSVATTKLVADV